MGSRLLKVPVVYDMALIFANRIGKNTFINFNAVFLDTCQITIGSNTLVGPNCSFYSATHPLDPRIRDGLRGPELGKPISIGKPWNL